MERSPDPAEHSVAGQRIGKYELISRLARGGMAELFVAKVTGLEGFQKIVALKRILPHLAGDAEFVEMFLAEARLAAALEHPNIVPVFDFGKAGNDYFFAMPYIHGKDLLAILRASQKKHVRLPLAQAIGIVVGISAGLHYTHDRVGYDGGALGIVHRDISPANVLVTFDGHIKVADFGIAKAAAQTSVTKIGVRKGKAAYMSPEQVRGQPVDRRSDIFSIGIVLWELLTMRRLFRGDDDLAIMHCIVSSAAPPPSSAVAGIPPVLDAIVAKCLEPNVELRYQTAKALLEDLQAFATAHGLTIAAGPLADYLETLFDRPAPPWTSAPALPVVAREAGSSGARPPATGALQPGDGFAHGGTAHIHRTEEVTR
ncbi:MAG: serine/threonine protein kinase, partial [Nannocystaceae bacterium]|nr:serine/threonine protein kinase [Nannocystaceae bacterium]